MQSNALQAFPQTLPDVQSLLVDIHTAILTQGFPPGGDYEKKVTFITSKFCYTGTILARVKKGFEKIDRESSCPSIRFEALRTLKKSLQSKALSNEWESDGRTCCRRETVFCQFESVFGMAPPAQEISF